MGESCTEIDPETNYALDRCKTIQVHFFMYDCQNLSYINRLEIPGKGAIGNPFPYIYCQSGGCMGVHLRLKRFKRM